MNGQEVCISYKAYLNPQGLDAPQVSAEPFEICTRQTHRLGEQTLITGLEMALRFVNPESDCLIKVIPRFGYGDKGVDSLVPPQSALLYSLQLHSLGAEMKSPEHMNAKEKLHFANARKNKGNTHFNKGEYSTAIELFNQGLKFLEHFPVLESEETVQKEFFELRIATGIKLFFKK